MDASAGCPILSTDVMRLVIDNIPLTELRTLSAIAVADTAMGNLVDTRVMAAI